MQSEEVVVQNEEAPLTLLVFTDPSCKYCKEFEQLIRPRLEMDYVHPGFLKIETKVYPLQRYGATTTEEELSLARTLGVTRVPTFFLNGEKQVGLPRWIDFSSWIDRALQEL